MRCSRDNLFGLELDPRCTQIAAFALAFAAWKTAGGYQSSCPLPEHRLLGHRGRASSTTGRSSPAATTNWARARPALRPVPDAPSSGSLIDPPRRRRDIFSVDFDRSRRSLDRALCAKRRPDDPAAAVFGAAAAGTAKAARCSPAATGWSRRTCRTWRAASRPRTCGRTRGSYYPTAKADLATAFLERCLDYARTGGRTALVTPQNWLFLGSYSAPRTAA